MCILALPCFVSVFARVCAKMEVLEGALDWLDFHDGVDATSLRSLEIISTSLLVLEFSPRNPN